MTTLAEFKPVEATTGRPLYVAVRESVHDAIARGRLEPGERLPSTKKLSEQLDVSLVTVHRALNDLVSSGVLRRGQGRGTFVHENFAKPEHIACDVRFGLVFQPASTLADPYHGRVLQGVRDAADEHGIDLVLLRYGEDWRRECAGYLYVNPFPDQLDHSPRYGVNHNKPAASGDGNGRVGGAVPVVGLGVNPSLRPGIGAVDTDNESMMRLAVSMLAGLGHERIAYLGDVSPASNSRDRERGFRAGCDDNGIGVDERWMIRAPGCTVGEHGIDHLVSLLGGRDGPSAVVASGYYFALDAYAAAKRAGVSIPEALSVIGVDDPPSAAHLSPPLTTFCQPLETLGRRGVELLLERIRGEHRSPRGHVTLEAELKERGSVGRPRWAPAGGA